MPDRSGFAHAPVTRALLFYLVAASLVVSLADVKDLVDLRIGGIGGGGDDGDDGYEAEETHMMLLGWWWVLGWVWRLGVWQVSNSYCSSCNRVTRGVTLLCWRWVV